MLSTCSLPRRWRASGRLPGKPKPSQSAQDGGNPSQKGAVPRCLGRTKGGLNSKLYAVTDQDGKSLILFLTPGQMSDHKGAKLMLPQLPSAKSLIGDKGYDSDAFRKALIEKGIEPCIPPKKNRKRPQPYDEALYKKRHKIENSLTATRYDRCAHIFFSSICIAASFIFYLR
jgi:transposase